MLCTAVVVDEWKIRGWRFKDSRRKIRGWRFIIVSGPNISCVPHRTSLSHVSYLLFVISFVPHCTSLSQVSHLLCLIQYLLFLIVCFWSRISVSSLSSLISHLLSLISYPFFSWSHMSFSCLISLISYLLSLISCLLFCWSHMSFSCLMSRISSLVSLVSYLLSLVSRLLSLISYLLYLISCVPDPAWVSFIACLLGSVLAGFLPIFPSQIWVSDVTFVTFFGDKNVTRYLCHISGKNVMLSRTKIFVELVTFFVTSFPKNVTFWPRQYKFFLNGRNVTIRLGLKNVFFLPVSDLSLISEAWSRKAFWAKTDPYLLSLISYACLLSHISRLSSHISCLLSLASYVADRTWVSHVSFLLSLISYLLSLASCFADRTWVSHVSCLVSHLSSLLSPISCLIPLVSFLLSHVSRLFSLISYLSSLISHLLSLITCLSLPPSLLCYCCLLPLLEPLCFICTILCLLEALPE